MAQADRPGADAPIPHPLLDQLNKEIQQVYSETRRSLVVVEVPLPAWVAQQFLEMENPLSKWEKELTPDVRRKLARDMQDRIHRVDALIVPGTQPAESPKTEPQPVLPIRPTVVMTGVLINDNGDVLIPLYVEKNIVAERPIRTLVGSEHVEAKFIGSDQQMNLSVFRLNRHAGKPTPISSGRPNEGELVLTLNPDGSAWDLHVWTGSRRDHGTVVRLNGQVSGFCRSGQFMSIATAMPIAAQIIDHGVVHRATLGVRISEVRKDDPARHTNTLLAERPAVRVDEVRPGTEAERAGLKAGDLILSLAGEPVGELPTFASNLASRDGKTELRVLRGAEEKIIEVELLPK